MGKLKVEYQGKNKLYDLYKQITTVGFGEAADIEIPSLTQKTTLGFITQREGVYKLIFDKFSFQEFFSSKSKEVTLEEKKPLDLAGCKLTFYKEALPAKEEEQNTHELLIQAHQKLFEFSKKIAQEKNIKNLLEILLEEIATLTKAEYGFLVLLENGEIKIHAQKNLAKGQMDDRGIISDTILNKVIRTKKPIIVSNASCDDEFSSSMSVINYRLSSVMCVPLSYQGQVFGAIYVGNNSLANLFTEKSLSLMSIYSSQAALLVQNALHINRLESESGGHQTGELLHKLGDILGASEPMQNVFKQIKRFAQTGEPILVHGPSGTEKIDIAKEIHRHSQRAHEPIVTLKCHVQAAFELEKELFGYVRGAFDGALKTTVGKLHLADKGTLILEEIANISPGAQDMLLEYLKSGNVKKIGDKVEVPVDVRIVATTTEDLREAVRKRAFSEELFYRLSISIIKVPSIKDRGNDVFMLANLFLQKHAQLHKKAITSFEEDAQKLLLSHLWEGNIYELEASIKRAVILCSGNKINVADMGVLASKNSEKVLLVDALEQFKEKYIKDCLERNLGNKTQTAKELGVDPRTIFRFLENQKKNGD